MTYNPDKPRSPEKIAWFYERKPRAVRTRKVRYMPKHADIPMGADYEAGPSSIRWRGPVNMYEIRTSVYTNGERSDALFRDGVMIGTVSADERAAVLVYLERHGERVEVLR